MNRRTNWFSHSPWSRFRHEIRLVGAKIHSSDRTDAILNRKSKMLGWTGERYGSHTREVWVNRRTNRFSHSSYQQNLTDWMTSGVLSNTVKCSYHSVNQKNSFCAKMHQGEPANDTVLTLVRFGWTGERYSSHTCPSRFFCRYRYRYGTYR